MILRNMERLIRLTPEGHRTFFDNAAFPWISNLEANWKIIRAEVDEFMRQPEKLPNIADVLQNQEYLSENGEWKLLVLYGLTHRVDSNCSRVPKTAELLESIPEMTSAVFSVLAPRKRIPKHRGTYKGILRYHLGLIIPEPDTCGIRVSSEERFWREGESLIFDDSYIHEAWNDSDSYRVVLIVDVIRPLPFPFSALNRAVISRISRFPSVAEDIERARQAGRPS
jgi:beta-hydroxylase